MEANNEREYQEIGLENALKELDADVEAKTGNRPTLKQATKMVEEFYELLVDTTKTTTN